MSFLELRSLPDEFAIWAFGREAWDEFLLENKSSEALIKAWNQQHGHLYRVKRNTEAIEMLIKMMEVWIKEIGWNG